MSQDKAIKTHVVSFSGGRTSAYLVHLMEEKRKEEGWDVKFIFMDTGAEHPATYQFIRDVVASTGIELTCLRTVFNPELGKANTYQIIPLSECKPDLQPWRDMLSKYSTPYNPSGAFCTDRMKLVPYTKYCNETFGREGYTTWLGIRADETKRLKPREHVDYLASISDFDKQDVFEWWDEQPYNLGIEDPLGNCVFCIKKGTNKIAIAERYEPEMAKEFMAVLEEPTVRVVEKRKAPLLSMYRGQVSMKGVIQMFSANTTSELEANVKNMRRFDTGSCSESCEVFNE